jgi:hypothetical protein
MGKHLFEFAKIGGFQMNLTPCAQDAVGSYLQFDLCCVQ